LKLQTYPELLRVNHWAKNAFVLAPLFFSGHFTDWAKLSAVLLAFLAMSLSASAIYILNDLADADKDRLHPVKKSRPIAAGKIAAKPAKQIMLVFAALGLGLAFSISLPVGLLLLAYIGINIFYSIWLKHIPVLDISLIGLGFLIRILMGGEAGGIQVSHWLVIITFVLALFLALGKRHDDLLHLEKTGTLLRKSLAGYNLKFTSHAMTLLAGALFLLYFQYLELAPTVAQFAGKMPYLSSIFVLLGMLRYLQATFVYEKSGSPVKQVFSDRFLQIIFLGWLSHFIFMLYF